MYIFHLISIDLESSRSCNSSHCKAYSPYSMRRDNILQISSNIPLSGLGQGWIKTLANMPLKSNVIMIVIPSRCS